MKFIKDLENFLRGKFANYPSTNAISLEPCPAGQEGDFTINCFKIGKFCGNPMVAAQTTVEFLSSHEDIEQAVAVKATATNII